jgi:hypothetical protein
MVRGTIKPIGMSASEYEAKYAKPYIGSKPRTEWFKGLGAKGLKVKRVSGR